MPARPVEGWAAARARRACRLSRLAAQSVGVSDPSRWRMAHRFAPVGFFVRFFGFSPFFCVFFSLFSFFPFFIFSFFPFSLRLVVLLFLVGLFSSVCSIRLFDFSRLPLTVRQSPSFAADWLLSPSLPIPRGIHFLSWGLLFQSGASGLGGRRPVFRLPRRASDKRVVSRFRRELPLAPMSSDPPHARETHHGSCAEVYFPNVRR